MRASSCRFGPFQVDRDAYAVTREGQRVPLTPKLLDLLLYFLDRPAQLVTKEELLDALWPGANVTENALAQAVSELRQGLGDAAGNPRFIRTIARRGYRFIATIEPGEEPVAAPGAPDLPTRAGATDAGARAVAVMDFANVSGEPDDAWLAAGIAETVTGDLRRAGVFKVVERRLVAEATRRTDGSVEQTAAELGVDLVVLGSFQRHGDQIRIVARLVDPVRGEALADSKVDGRFERIFELQDQIALTLSKELGVRTGAAGGTGLGARETASLDAYRAHLEGALRLESLDVRELQPARQDFERAVSLDPRYALAYAGLSSAEFALYETTRDDNEPAQHQLDRAIEHARHAVELDEGLAEAHAALALALVSAWRTAEAVAAARRAVALEPSSWRHSFRLGHACWGDARLTAASRTLALYPEFAFAHFQVAMVHVARGHLARAESVLREGVAVQERQAGRLTRFPALGLHWLLGLVRLAQDDPVRALDEFDRELRLADPHRLYGREYAVHAHDGRGAARLRINRLDEAADAFARALELYPDHAPARLGIAQVLRRRGAAGEAEVQLARVDEALATLTRSRPFEAATIRSMLLAERDRLEEAVGPLEGLLADAPPGFAGWTLPVEPWLHPLHAHPAFAGVLRQLADRAT